MMPSVTFKEGTFCSNIVQFLTSVIPGSSNRHHFWLRLQKDLVHRKPKTNVLFVQLDCLTKYVCVTGTQIPGSRSTKQNCLGSGSSSSHPKLLGLRLHSLLWAYPDVLVTKRLRFEKLRSSHTITILILT